MNQESLGAALEACSHQRFDKATLYVVATPIGNLADITLRAWHVLKRVDAVACEDTRVAAHLLRHLGLHKPLLALHTHNERSASESVLARLALGESVALISDAGTPAISDPGALLVDAVRQARHRVVPIPGASAVIAALSAAGSLGSDSSRVDEASGYRFVGFLPAKGQPRERALQAALAVGDAVVFYEAPHRIGALAAEVAASPHAARRDVTLARELTKQFEAIDRMPIAAWPAWLSGEANRQRGEFVVVIHAQARMAAAQPGDDGAQAAGLDERFSQATLAHSASPDAWLAALLALMPLKQAVSLVAAQTSLPRNAVYERALALRDLPGPGEA